MDQGSGEEITWNIPLAQEETRKLIMTAESETLIRYSYADLKVVEDPKIQVINLNQQPITYGSSGNMTFTLSSEHYAKNIKVLINRIGQVDVTEIDGKYDVSVPYSGKSLYDGKVSIQVIYEDELGKQYTTKRVFKATITDIPWHIQLLNWINSLVNRQD